VLQGFAVEACVLRVRGQRWCSGLRCRNSRRGVERVSLGVGLPFSMSRIEV
jgi:hypothetical protein